MKLLVSHPTGNTFVRALLEYANKKDVLESFHTTIAYRDGNWTNRLMPQGVRNQYERRAYPIPDEIIHRHSFRETIRLVAAKVGLANLTEHEKGWASLDEVYRELDRKTAQSLTPSDITHVHCYEDGALDTFRQAGLLGIRRSYELPIAYWKKMRELLEMEAERLPQWAPTLIATEDSTEKLARKDEELALADSIAVPSQFVLDSLPEFIRKDKTCIVAPFGTPLVDTEKNKESKPYSKKTRFLFAGSMGQRKGLGDVLNAFSEIRRNDVELVILGQPMMEMEFYRKEFDDFIYEAPRPHADVLKLMRSCHVLILPSIAEGRALVQQEAMSQEMALLVTPNAGGEDLVIEGETGVLVPPGNPEALVTEILNFADHPQKTISMGENAKRHASNYTWKAYAAELLSTLAT
ncbi:MAG: glycosyltransferase family 4 protein [Opitutae bacterium]|nr:glycosyltransferase family 4 protein [Opitutae bacterium]